MLARRAAVPTVALLIVCGAVSARAQTAAPVTLGGKPQTVHLYRPEGPAGLVVLSSGDLGWRGFVVDVAEFLSSRHVAVVGFNTRAYLESFTIGKARLDPQQVPGDYETLAREAARLLSVGAPPVLAGISEGAGLSVIAATDPARQSAVAGVIGLGLPDRIELGWRAWRDWTIWITKGNPKEPHASVTDYVSKVSPVPLVMIQSTRDEFVPPETARTLFESALEPKHIFYIEARNHRFSDKRDELHASLLEALAWIAAQPRPARSLPSRHP